MKPFIALASVMLMLAVTAASEAAVSLTPAWKTQPVFDVPEAIILNSADRLLYVSNVAGKPAEKNGKGFISKMDASGKVTELKWATGLNAPKGLAIAGNSLYVSDIDELVQISLESGAVEKRYPAEGAVFLNDVAADAGGHVYVSDSSSENSVIYRLSEGELEPWLTAPEIVGPNGLHMLEDQLLVGSGKDGRLNSVDLKTKTITLLAQTDAGIDGLKPDGKGNYLTSNWSGRTTLITAAGKTVVLMDTTEDGINSADFEYLADKKLLLIPTFFDNRVAAYTVEY